MHYSIIRYVPDVVRMEPINVGLLLTSAFGTQVRIYPHSAKRKGVDTLTFRQWRDFLLSEVEGPPVASFQPNRSTPAFLSYLSTLCTAQVRLSAPLYVQASDQEARETIFEDLYRRLVVPPEEPALMATRVTDYFKQIVEEKNLGDRGLKKNRLITINATAHFNPYQQYKNGHILAIDKVECGTQLRLALQEICAAQRTAEYLEQFRKMQGEYFFMMDDFKTPFREQSVEEFDVMRRDIDALGLSIQKHGGTLVRSASEVAELGAQLDSALPKMHKPQASGT
jgi:Protein of unknown function (DUF3037)